MTKLSTLLMTLGLGAGAMYLFDPQLGNRRRAMVRDQVSGLRNDLSENLEAATRDLNNRAQGLVAETRGRLRNEQPDDHTLAERVRASLGWAVSHPRAIDVEAHDGVITLRGPILAFELERLLGRVRRVRGVKRIDNQLEVHAEPGNVPGLQGDVDERWDRMRTMQNSWAPGPRLLASVAGGTLLVGGLLRGGVMGTARSVIGVGLLARALSNKPLGQFIGANGDGNGRTSAIPIRKGITVNAPVDEVFQFWSNYENLARFMTNIEEVRDLGDGRSHWVVKGPAGMAVEWDARITGWVSNELIAWRSEPGSTVEQVGVVRFKPAPDGGTHIDVHMSYTPPAGALGHAFASLLGANPKQQMDEDLARFKSLMEHGQTTAHGQNVSRYDVEPGS